MKIKPFQPLKLPLDRLKCEQFIDLLGPAHAVIARYDEVIKRVKNPKKVFSLLTEEEVYHSCSQKYPISLEEWLNRKVLPREKKGEIMLNYRRALLEAKEEILHRPLSLSFIRKIHSRVKQSKTNSKEIGRFRTRQNWIGPEGCPIEEAYFYPPDVNALSFSLQNLKKYWSHEEKDLLVHLAVFIAQFLIIHPFMDGNGRVTRILIPLFLYKKRLTSFPMFYLSGYLKKHRIRYFEKLFAITSEDKWEEWIRFFLTGIIEEGKRLVEKVNNLSKGN